MLAACLQAERFVPVGVHSGEEALAALRESPRAHIFNVASVAARQGFAGCTAYCATKYGLRGFGDALREDLRESGEIESYSKKMTSQLQREKKKITRNLQGIRTMHKLPGALIAVDVKREMNALHEAHSLGIPTICLIDTDGDPDLVDIPIPGNDDSMRSIDVIVRELCEAITLGKTGRADQTETPVPETPTADDRRRSQRTMFRADEAAPPNDVATVGTSTDTTPA
ncbi:MAG: 30S ribosomal protein S2 [Planctomycetes bacterium]|nr:30S ribosomal protein S2 [Planctomycetota bacterium]